MNISETELIQRIALAREGAERAGDTDCRSFVVRLCARLEDDCPELAKAIADGAGMSHLYEK